MRTCHLYSSSEHPFRHKPRWLAWHIRSVRCLIVLAVMALATLAHADDNLQFHELDLTGPFATKSPWTLTAMQGPPTADPSGLDNSIPGIITLCLHTVTRPACARDLLNQPPTSSGEDPAWATTRNVDRVEIVPVPAGKYLMVRTSGPHGANNSHWSLTQVLAYNRANDQFRSLFAETVGSNNNQEIRLLGSGPLAGDIVTAEPTSDAPYAYWITLEAPTSTGYRSQLHFRSATHYGDGNPLAVIDAEMPNILHRLGKPSALPNASPSCPAPHLRGGALWCVGPVKLEN